MNCKITGEETMLPCTVDCPLSEDCNEEWMEEEG